MHSPANKQLKCAPIYGQLLHEIKQHIELEQRCVLNGVTSADDVMFGHAGGEFYVDLEDEIVHSEQY